MKEKNDASLISTINRETSFITYKKVQLMTKEIQTISKQNEKKSKNANKIKNNFFYDKYTNQFIYINDEVIVILDTKCKMKTFSRYKI